MVMAFLLGLLASLGTIVVIMLSILTVKWIKAEIEKKLKAHKSHKVAFADTREIMDSYLKKQAEGTPEISMDDLEAICEKTPFVMADYDEDTEDVTYEGVKPDEIEGRVRRLMRQHDGMLVVGG